MKTDSADYSTSSGIKERKQHYYLFFGLKRYAQTEDSEKIYNVVEEMPIFPGCTDSTDTSADLRKCAEQKLLEFIYTNIKYPEIDIEKGNEGTAVVTFVVEKDGSISNAAILKNPGEELGQEALRVVNLMNEMPEKWIPGKLKGEPVKVQFNLPVKFKLEVEDEPDFVLSGNDSIYVNFDTPPAYIEGDKALINHIDLSLRYPNEGQDSCRIGIIEVNTIIYKDSSLSITDVTDYSDLGIDYQFEAIRILNATSGDWIPATKNGKLVNTTRTIRIVFRPNYVSCGEVIADFDVADRMVDEGAALLEAGKSDEGIAKLSRAIEMFPNNGEYLSIRGQAYLKLQKTEEACMDLKKAKSILLVSWFDSLLPVLCK